MSSVRVALSAIAVVVAALLPAAPAAAHAEIIDSTPEAGSTVTVLPDEFTLIANEDLLVSVGVDAFVVKVLGPDDVDYASGVTPTIDGPTISVPAAVGPDGEYRLVYRVVSADGHPIEGLIPFVVALHGGASADEPSTAEAPSTADEPGVEAGTTASGDDPADAGGLSPAVWAAGGIALAALLALVILLARRGRSGPA